MAITYDNNPNTILEEVIEELGYSILTSFDPGFDQVDGATRGIGSLRKRSIAARVAMYNPFNWAIDTYIQLMGGFHVVDSEIFEWIQKDAFLPFQATGLATPDDADDVINNVDDNPTSEFPGAGATTGKFQVSADDSKIFRPGDIVRYVASVGGEDIFVEAHVDSIAKVSANKYNLVLSAIDSDIFNENNGDVLLPAKENDAYIERGDSVRGSDLNYDPQPRGKLPKTYRSVVQVIVHDDSWTPRSMNVGAYIDFLQEKEEDLFMELRRSRERRSIYGKQGLLTLANGDKVYTSPGIHDLVKTENLVTFDPTNNGSFHDRTFEDKLIDYVESAWGGESGGPYLRESFINARMATYLSKAFRDRQRFYANEFVAGVHCMRYEDPNGVADFVKTSFADYMAPRPGTSVRESNTKAFALTIPVNECITRVVMNGEGPYSEHFIQKGGDRVNFLRTGTTEGVMTTLLQYASLFEEE